MPSKLKSGSGKVVQKCEYCGKKFTTYASRIKRGGGKFCSRECHYKFKSEKGNQIRICPQCGKKFKTIKSSEQTYCSSKCAGKAVRKGKVRICPVCNKEFYFPPCREKRKRKYCSRECADIGRRNKIKLTCANCGVEFQVSQSLENRKFCSEKCKYEYIKGEKHPRYVKKVKKVCEFCGKEYKIVPSKENSKYCSRECQSKALIGKYTGEKSPVYSRIKKICPVCHKEFTVKLSQTVRSKDNCCSRECANRWTALSGKLSDEKNPAWLGGYAKKDLAMYATYAHRIEYAEQVRKSPIDENILQVNTYCGRWFSPKLGSLMKRVSYLEGKSENESRLYCSNRCKKSCPIYQQKLFPKGYKIVTSREVQPELRQMRLALDDYTCQRCQKTIDEAELHCHHITGVKQNPIESADLDNCITLCKKCHKWAHTQKGCRYFELTCK